MLKQYLIGGLLLAVLFSSSALSALPEASPQVLARVDGQEITADDLEEVVQSSPFGTQFVAMNEGDQAALRGDLLRRLVLARLLYLEAQRLGLDRSDEFLKDIEGFRLGLLYRHYMDKLRERIQVPEEIQSQMKTHFKGDSDGLTAARSAYLAERFRALRQLTLGTLRTKYRVQVYEDRLLPGAAVDTLLLEGDGLAIRYADLGTGGALAPVTNPEWLRDQLYRRAELLVVAKAADDEGVDVTTRVQSYRSERLPALLMERKQSEWVGGEQSLRDYFAAHPEIGLIEERRHIGQLVSASREEAESLRTRILAGESLFTLAGQRSVDPYGRSHNGDLGWIKAGRGMVQIEQALAGLADGEISPVIETPLGFHLVTIIERRPGGTRSFAGVRDRLQQALVAERLTDYARELEERFPVVWNLLQPSAEEASQARPLNGG